jgi:hypothetical protein
MLHRRVARRFDACEEDESARRRGIVCWCAPPVGQCSTQFRLRQRYRRRRGASGDRGGWCEFAARTCFDRSAWLRRSGDRRCFGSFCDRCLGRRAGGRRRRLLARGNGLRTRLFRRDGRLSLICAQ